LTTQNVQNKSNENFGPKNHCLNLFFRKVTFYNILNIYAKKLSKFKDN